MGKFLEKLMDLSGPELSENISGTLFENLPMEYGDELVMLLGRKNGFYAFESALHVFPDKSIHNEIGVVEWNKKDLWVGLYGDLVDGCFFFAEDIFGGQFCFKKDGIYCFDPETGSTRFLSSTLEGWVQLVIDDYRALTGYPVAHEWQKINGPLPIGMRLVPKIPFVVGGQFAIDNLFLLDSVKAMQLRANLAAQIKDLPDGSSIQWKFVS